MAKSWRSPSPPVRPPLRKTRHNIRNVLMSLQSYLEEQRQRVEARLNELVPPETEPPDSIHRAMRYSLFAGGKRIRPIFCLESARVVFENNSVQANPNGEQADLEAISCSLE